MKNILIYSIVLLTILIFGGCNNNPAPQEVKTDLINDEFPEAKAEVMQTFAEIAQSIKDGDIDKLISFHAYGLAGIIV